MSQQPAGGDAMETARRFSPALFGIIAICFLLPFVAITCSGTEMFELKGLDLVTGTEVGPDDLSSELREGFNQFEEGFGGDLDQETDETDKIPAEPAAIIALALAVIGLIAGFAMRDGKGPFVSAVIGVLGVLALIALRIMFKVDAGEGASAQEIDQAENLIGYDWGLGWWLTLLLFLVQPILHFTALRDRFAPRGATPGDAGSGGDTPQTPPVPPHSGAPPSGPPPAS